MQRIDVHPTHTHGQFKLRRGNPAPFGATFVPGGVNFSIFSSHATSCTLVLLKNTPQSPLERYPFPMSLE